MLDAAPRKTQNGTVGSNYDRYVYSIMATVLSELEPDTFHQEIVRCVEVIKSRQLGSGMWSYRDPNKNERDEYKDGYAQARPNDFELPQAFYAVCGLESARVHANIQVDTEIFMKALRGILYTQNLNGTFSNYPEKSTRDYGMRCDLTAWGLGMVAVCIRNGLVDIEQDPDLLIRALIGREAARLLLVNCSRVTSPLSYQLRELAFTFGNKGVISENAADTAIKFAPLIGTSGLYTQGYPEPADSDAPPWIDEPVIEAKNKTHKSSTR
jgi:hypothetical protein